MFCIVFEKKVLVYEYIVYRYFIIKFFEKKNFIVQLNNDRSIDYVYEKKIKVLNIKIDLNIFDEKIFIYLNF